MRGEEGGAKNTGSQQLQQLILLRGRERQTYTPSPAMTLSMACSKCVNFTSVARNLAAINAASLHTLATSAPVKPGVLAASFLASSSRFKWVLMGFKCTLKMDALGLEE